MWTGSIYAKAPAGVTIRPRINWSNSTSSNGTSVTSTGALQRISVTATVPAGVTAGGPAVERMSGGTAATGDIVIAVAAMMTLGGTLIDYFDGSFAELGLERHRARIDVDVHPGVTPRPQLLRRVVGLG